MHLFDCWKNSLTVFNKENIYYFFNKFSLTYLLATKFFFKYFSWLFILDLLVFLVFGKYCINFIDAFGKSLKDLSICSIISYFTLLGLWYLLNSVYFICIILGVNKFNWHNFGINFKRYFQIVFVTTIFVQLILFLLSILGVHSYPNIHWFIKLIIRFLEIITLFYWLESNFKKREIFLSMEKSANFWFYNFPFFIITVIVGIILNFSHKFVYDLFFVNFSLDRTLGTWALIKALMIKLSGFDLSLYIQIFLIKTSKFFINYLVLTFIYTFYFFRKNKNYSDSVLITQD